MKDFGGDLLRRFRLAVILLRFPHQKIVARNAEAGLDKVSMTAFRVEFVERQSTDCCAFRVQRVDDRIVSPGMHDHARTDAEKSILLFGIG